MRIAFFILALGSIPAFPQQRGMYGGVSTGQMVGSINSTGFASGLGATVSSLPQTGRVIPMGPGVYSHPVRTPGHSWQGRGSRTVAIPWGFTGGYMPAVYPAAEVVPVNVPQVQSTPAVIINQYYSPDLVRPQMREYDDLPEARSTPRPAPRPAAPPAPVDPQQTADSTKATITLLAFKDASVVAAIAYWQQENDLHFVTNSFSKKIVPAASLDKTLSEQLNKERKVEFKLESMR